MECVDSMTSFIITCILGMTPDTSDTHHSEKCKCQQLDYVHPPTAPYHQKKKEGSRREEKFFYATAPHAAAAAHHVALLHTIVAKCEFVQKKHLFLDIKPIDFDNRTKCQIFNLDLEFHFGFSQIAQIAFNCHKMSL